MERTPHYYSYVQILREELIPAMGCTEPIALAYCAAAAREAAGDLEDSGLRSVTVWVSGNIIKNVKSVIVPNTGGLRGIETAVAAGLASGRQERRLEVLSSLDDAQRARLRELRQLVQVHPAQTDAVLYVEILLTYGGGTARAILEGSHTGLTLLERNGQVLFREDPQTQAAQAQTALTVHDIFDFVQSVTPEELEPLVGRQIDCNLAIARAGLEEPWGANVGKVLLQMHGSDWRTRARACAAAGSDARMSGCELPVIIVSGSGNQGITASVPVAIFAEHMGATREQLLRAVALSDLVTIQQKTGIGCLSAFCGAVCAGCGAGAGIAYLETGDYKAVTHTIVNALAIVSGMVCDGAKPSCAAKIASAVDAGILGYELYRRGQEFRDGDGIVKKGVDNTIGNVGRMARTGMRETDRVILEIMCGC